MDLEQNIDNRLIQNLPANTPITAYVACGFISRGDPQFAREGWQEMVPVRLQALSNFGTPENTDTLLHYHGSLAGNDLYMVNTNSVAWRQAHPEHAPNHDIHLNNPAGVAPQEAPQGIPNVDGEPLPFNGDIPQDVTDNLPPPNNEHQLLLAVPEPNLDYIVVPFNMTLGNASNYVRDINEMADPEFRNRFIRNYQLSRYSPKRLYVSNRWKIALRNPHLRIKVITIVVALDYNNSWIQALLEELTAPSISSRDDSIAPVAPFEVSYIAIPTHFRSETDRRRAIGYLVLLKCMKDSQEVKNKVIETLIDWEKPRYQKIFINTMKAIATCICDRQISQLFDDLSPDISWAFLIREVMA